MSQDDTRRPNRGDAPTGARPPSFAPSSARPRPDTRGARQVSGNDDPAATRQLPTTPAGDHAGGPARRSITQQPRGTAPGTSAPAAAAPSARSLPSHHPGGQQPATRIQGTGSPHPGHGGSGGPPGDSPGHQPGHQPGRPAKPRKRRRIGRRIAVLLLVLLIGWPIGLLVWANGQLTRVDALSSSADTPGRTYLLAGSDSRDDSDLTDDTEGERADTIMLLHIPSSGTRSLISLPRDTYVEIPGHGWNKLNAAYSFGGAALLVTTVENLTGLGVDHYVEVGMGGIQDVVDSLGSVELCLDYDVDDWRSELQWEAGCHEADGATALAFARMRYSDPAGDIGRAERQRQLISSMVSEVASPGTLLNPAEQVSLLGAGTGALRVDQGTNILDLGRMALGFRDASGADGVVGAPPISDYNYRPGGVGSTVLLDPDRIGTFWRAVTDGSVTDDDTD